MMPISWRPYEAISAAERHRAGVLLRDGARCARTRENACRGRLQAHHVIPRQRLRIALGRDNWVSYNAEADSRNGVMLCERHHAQEHLLTWAEIPDPEGLEDFAEQYGLTWSLDRDLGTRPGQNMAPGQLDRTA